MDGWIQHLGRTNPGLRYCCGELIANSGALTRSRRLVALQRGGVLTLLRLKSGNRSGWWRRSWKGGAGLQLVHPKEAEANRWRRLGGRSGPFSLLLMFLSHPDVMGSKTSSSKEAELSRALSYLIIWMELHFSVELRADHLCSHHGSIHTSLDTAVAARHSWHFQLARPASSDFHPTHSG